MKIVKLLPFLFLFSCIDLMIQEEKINSLYFKGGSWIEFGKLDSMKLESNDFTLQFWVSGGEVDTNEAPAIFSIIDSTDRITLALLRDANQSNILTTIINSNVTPSEFSWLDWSDPDNFYLISILFSDSKGIKLYIDSTKIFSDEKFIDVVGNMLNIGAIVNKTRTIRENFWYGYIDEVRFWNTRLADSTITFQYAHPEKLGDYYRYTYYDSLIGLWRFNWDKPLSTIEDESDFNNDGTIYTLKGFSVELSEKGAQ